MVLKTRKRTTWKPDFTKDDPWEDVPLGHRRVLEEEPEEEPEEVPPPKVPEAKLPEPIVEREFATEKHLQLLRKFLAAGTLGQKGLTRELYLTRLQALELGYEVPEGEDFFRLAPTEAGKVPEPTILPPSPEVELFKRIYTDKFTPETKVQSVIEGLIRQATENPQTFLDDLRERGKSADTIQILQMFSSEPLTQEDVDSFFEGIPEIATEQQLLMKALPLLVKPRTIEWATKYFGDNPDKLRRDLITVGRNPDTEAYVKSLFPNISEQGVKDYFSPDFRKLKPAVPIRKLIGKTPLGKEFIIPEPDLSKMTPAERVAFEANPQQWLKDKEKWAQNRVASDRIKIIAESLGFPTKLDSTTEEMMLFINTALWILPIPLEKLGMAGYQAGKRLLPKGAQESLGGIEQVLKRITDIKIGGKGEVKVPPEVAEKIKGIAKEPISEAPKVEIKPVTPEVYEPFPAKEALKLRQTQKNLSMLSDKELRRQLGEGTEGWNQVVYGKMKKGETVTVYRVVPKGVDKINIGDRVTHTEESAKLVMEKMYLPKEAHILSVEAKPGDLIVQMPNEFLYVPTAPEIPKAIPKVGKIIPEEGIPEVKPSISEVKQTEFENKYVSSKGIKPPPPSEPPTASIQMPSDMPASQQVANHISFEPDKPSLVGRFLRGKNKAISQWIDKLYPIDTFTSTAKKLGAKISLEENPYIQARLLEGVVSKATSFLDDGTFGRTFWKMEKGKAVPNFKGESLSKILDEIKEPTAWRDFSTYLTSLRAKELGKLGIKTGITDDIATKAITELETKYPKFAGLSDKIQKYQSDLLDYIQESGLISADLRKTLDSKYASYVPLHRVLEELQGKGYMGKKMVDIVSPIKRIKGSEREIINPLESIVKNTYAFINAADRNEVGIAMARLVNKVPELQGLFEPIKTPIARVAQVTAKELGMSVEGLSDDAIEGVFNIFRPSMFTPDDVVTVMIDGKKQFFKVDPDLKVALTAMDTANMGMLWRVLSSPAKWLRAGATLSPDFAIRNPLRDQMSALVYSNYGFIPGVDFLKGVAHILKKDSTYKLYKMAGSERSMLVSLDREYLSKSFKEVVEGKGFTGYVKHPLELLQIASELGEKATRLGEFAKGIKRGAIPLEAGFSSREVTLDFAKAGTQAKAVNQIIAFFNAQIRDPDRMIQAFKEHPIRTSTKVFAFITSPSIALWVANHDDPRWKEIPQWQKDLFWIVMIGENIYRIPKPFGLGQLFGSAPERFLDYLETKDPNVIKKFISNFLQSALPGGLPTGLEPIIENITNHSFFRGTPVVPESLKDLPPELQYTEYTSELAKRMGKILHYSPMKIDNLLYGWTGGLGRYATEGIDKILQGTGIVAPKIEPSPTLADLPVVRAFVVRNPIGGSSESVNTFYDELDSYTSIEKLLKGLIEDGRKDEFEKEKAKHPELLFAYDEKTDIYYSASARYLRRVSGELSDIRKLQDKVYKSTTMTPEKKRELIDALDTIKTEMAKRALELIRNPSKEVGILETPIKEIEDKIGIITGDPLSQNAIKITDIASELSQAKGESPLKKLLERNNTILVDIANLPDTPLYQIDRATTKAGLTRRQNELLDQYEASTDKKAFLKEHPELKENPKQKWLIDHPEENAILALWGNAKLLTQKAYDIAMSMVEKNDIPDNALEERILPPKGLAEPYFSLMEAKEKWGDSSWEAKLILAKNKGLVEWNPAWTLPDTPIASLELKTEKTYRATWRKLEDEDDPDWVGNLDDKIKDKDGLTARDRAIAKLKATKIGDMTYIDIDRKIKAIERGTDDNPIADELVNAYVSHYQIVDKTSGNSAEAKLDRYDNPKLNDFMMNEDYWGKLKAEPLDEDKFYLDNYLVPRWRIEVDEAYKAKDTEYNAIKNPIEAEQSRLRAEWLAEPENAEYRKNKRKKEALELSNPKTGERLPTTDVETYVDYYEIPSKPEGKRQERFIVENNVFAETMFRLTGKAMWKVKHEDVPNVAYDDIYDKYEDLFEERQLILDTTIDEEEQNQKIAALFAENPAFKEAYYRRAGYGLLLPDQHVEDYVTYMLMPEEGWAKERYLKLHPEFYEEIKKKKEWKTDYKWDEIPSEKVEREWFVYDGLSTSSRKYNYRLDHPDLDAWLVLTGKVKRLASETERRKGLTEREKFLEDIAKKQSEFEKKMAELRKKLGGL